MSKRKKTDSFREAVEAAKAREPRDARGLHSDILIALGLDLDTDELQEVTADLEREGIVPGQLAGLPPWHIEALDDKFGWSYRFDTK